MWGGARQFRSVPSRQRRAPVTTILQEGGREEARALVGYSDHGVTAEAIRGTMSFGTDGTFRTEGAVRYPGEPEAPLTSSGTWIHDAAASRLSLATSEGTGEWDMTWAADTLVLTLANDPEARLPPSFASFVSPPRRAR